MPERLACAVRRTGCVGRWRTSAGSRNFKLLASQSIRTHVRSRPRFSLMPTSSSDTMFAAAPGVWLTSPLWLREWLLFARSTVPSFIFLYFHVSPFSLEYVLASHALHPSSPLLPSSSASDNHRLLTSISRFIVSFLRSSMHPKQCVTLMPRKGKPRAAVASC